MLTHADLPCAPTVKSTLSQAAARPSCHLVSECQRAAKQQGVDRRPAAPVIAGTVPGRCKAQSLIKLPCGMVVGRHFEADAPRAQKNGAAEQVFEQKSPDSLPARRWRDAEGEDLRIFGLEQIKYEPLRQNRRSVLRSEERR